MPRRLPKCAKCGLPLKGKAYTRHNYMGLPGQPEVGWHWAESGTCTDDPLHIELRDGAEPDRIEAILREIGQRGEGRVIANKRGSRDRRARHFSDLHPS